MGFGKTSCVSHIQTRYENLVGETRRETMKAENPPPTIDLANIATVYTCIEEICWKKNSLAKVKSDYKFMIYYYYYYYLLLLLLLSLLFLSLLF